MQVPQTVSIEWLELAAFVAIGAVVLAVSLSLATGERGAVSDRSHPRGERRRRRACRAFADAVARGDIESADRAAALVLEPPRERRERDHAVIGWDEHKLFVVPVEEIRRQFADPAANAFWFPDVKRRLHGGHVDIFLGRSEPIRLTLVSETWTPDDLAFTAACDDFQISGHVSLRTVIAEAGMPGEVRAAVEVWIHMETADCDDGRRALGRARNATRDGLGRMAAELNPL